MTDDISEIRRVAEKFREAIESSPKEKLVIGMQEFPRGACGDSVLLLGQYLIERGFQPFYRMSGETSDDSNHDDWSSHAWLQRGKLIVDITADQFGEHFPAVIVTEESLWHRGLNGEKTNIATFEIYDLHTKAALGATYSVIKRHLRER